MRWGMGHGLGVAMVALLLLGFREAFPIEAVSSWSERMVGVLLLAVGVWAIRKGLKVQVHAHRHVHDDAEHEHFHFHGPGHAHSPAPHSTAVPAHGHNHAALGIGALHGLAGSSHFFGVLPILAIRDVPAAISYIAGFACGTILAMGAFTALLGWASQRWASGPSIAYRRLLYASGSAALGVGAWWLWAG